MENIGIYSNESGCGKPYIVISMHKASGNYNSAIVS